MTVPTEDWSEFIPPGAEQVVELAGKWKHGYIPLDATALRIKMKGNTGGKKWWDGGGGPKKKRMLTSRDAPGARATNRPGTLRDNPSNSEYHAALGNKDGGPDTTEDDDYYAALGMPNPNKKSSSGKTDKVLFRKTPGKARGTTRKNPSRDEYFSGLGIKKSERPDPEQDMEDDDYYSALGMPNPNKAGSKAPAAKKASTPSHFQGNQKGLTGARMRYEANLPKKISATTHFGPGAEWRLRPGTNDYALHKNGKPVLDKHTGAPITAKREGLARALRGQFLRPESKESRSVHLKNFKKKQISEGFAPPTSGQRKTFAARGKADREASLRDNLSKNGPLDAAETKRITHLNSLKRQSPKAFTPAHQAELDHLNARKATHGRHEYKAGNKTGKIIGGSKSASAAKEPASTPAPAAREPIPTHISVMGDAKLARVAKSDSPDAPIAARALRERKAYRKARADAGKTTAGGQGKA